MRNAHPDRGLQADLLTVVSHDGLSHGGVLALGGVIRGGGLVTALATDLVLALVHGEEVQAGHHVQTRHGQRLAGCRGEDVVGG